MRISKTAIGVAAGAAAMLAAGCSHSRKASGSDTLPEIEVAEVETDSITLFKTYPGTLMSDNLVDVVARVNGYLRTSNFSGGDIVKKGQLLFTIEDQSYRDAVEQARAALTTAKSANEYATRQYAAMKKALESDAVSQMEVAEAKSRMEQSEADIKNAEASLQTALTNLGYCRVTAPVTGSITSRALDPGAYLDGEGAPVKLATIYDNSHVLASFFVEDDSFLRMFSTASARDGIDYRRIPIEFTEKLPHSYTGDLDYMAPTVDASTGTLEVRATIANPYNELRNGMYVSVKLPWRTDPKAILVKEASISTDQLGKFVYVVNDSGKVVYTPVKIGDLYADTMRVVTEGLRPGDRYVTKAMLKVRDGMEVKPVSVR